MRDQQRPIPARLVPMLISGAKTILITDAITLRRGAQSTHRMQPRRNGPRPRRFEFEFPATTTPRPVRHRVWRRQCRDSRVNSYTTRRYLRGAFFIKFIKMAARPWRVAWLGLAWRGLAWLGVAWGVLRASCVAPMHGLHSTYAKAGRHEGGPGEPRRAQHSTAKRPIASECILLLINESK